MPGSSLWLIPSDKTTYRALEKLIDMTIPAQFPTLENSPSFSPHVTLTSEIPASCYADNPQKYLETFHFPEGEKVIVNFKGLTVGEPFFKKLTLTVEKGEGLKELCKECRAQGVEKGNAQKAEDWVAEQWVPHCSLLYANISISPKEKAQCDRAVDDALKDNTGGSSTLEGWTGGAVWLVPTDRSIAEWKPIAVRIL